MVGGASSTEHSFTDRGPLVYPGVEINVFGVGFVDYLANITWVHHALFLNFLVI